MTFKVSCELFSHHKRRKDGNGSNTRGNIEESHHGRQGHLPKSFGEEGSCKICNHESWIVMRKDL